MQHFLLLFLTFLALSKSRAQLCHWREMAECTKQTMDPLENPNNILPSSEADLRADCKYTHSIRDCINNYTNRCMAPTTREISEIVIGGVLAPLNEICEPGSARGRAFVQHNSCKNKAYAQGRDCIGELVSSLEAALGDSTPHRDRLTALCCGMNRLYACLDEVILPACGAEARDFTVKLFEDLTLGGAQVGCSGFPPEQCEPLLPPERTEPKTTRNGFETFVNAFSPIWLPRR